MHTSDVIIGLVAPGLPVRSSLCKLNGLLLCGNNSVVECDLAKVEVAGSNPVSRSNFPPPRLKPSGAVAKW